ncbi:serine/threonine-protein kinase [Mycoplasma phocoenae]|uniref:mitogen-activated protein kinase kinase n=1 Tax=Mycoplasma phocoenae TaxID=754517 RepID=A0A858U195_9MOLU|nr:serine/threonine-protein kinase [Mycoplasma phocoenae]QJG66884.1 serine/threonine protein kinase [Mycoplasma phocoenae]
MFNHGGWIMMLPKLESRYQILDKNLGSGGMGQVWKCRDTMTDKIVAIKVLRADTSETEKKRFFNEIDSLKKIRSDFVSKYYDAYVDKNEQWIVMEYVKGPTLKRWIDSTSSLNLHVAINYAKSIALALSDIHKANIIHRDLKSSNIIITETSDIKIIDFGIALGENSLRHTMDGKVVGSPEYLAPELLKNSEPPSIQSDIYSLGILLYEMIEGHTPFAGGNINVVISKHLNQKVPNLSTLNQLVPQSVQNIINKCTAKNPRDRYEDMIALYNDLKTCLDKNRILDKPSVPGKKQRKSLIDLSENKSFTLSLIIIGSVLITIVIILLCLKLAGIL